MGKAFAGWDWAVFQGASKSAIPAALWSESFPLSVRAICAVLDGKERLVAIVREVVPNIVWIKGVPVALRFLQYGLGSPVSQLLEDE